MFGISILSRIEKLEVPDLSKNKKAKDPLNIHKFLGKTYNPPTQSDYPNIRKIADLESIDTAQYEKSFRATDEAHESLNSSLLERAKRAMDMEVWLEAFFIALLFSVPIICAMEIYLSP